MVRIVAGLKLLSKLQDMEKCAEQNCSWGLLGRQVGSFFLCSRRIA